MVDHILEHLLRDNDLLGSCLVDLGDPGEVLGVHAGDLELNAAALDLHREVGIHVDIYVVLRELSYDLTEKL